MHHMAGFGLGGVNFPQLLDAQRISLRVFAFVQFVFGEQLFAQMAARAFRKNGVLGEQLHPKLEVACGLAILAHAQVASCNAFD